MKKANASIPAIPCETWKSRMMSGTSGPRMFVTKEITKKIRNTRATMSRLRVRGWVVVNLLPLLRIRDLAGALEMPCFAAGQRGQRQRHHLHGQDLEYRLQSRVAL